MLALNCNSGSGSGSHTRDLDRDRGVSSLSSSCGNGRGDDGGDDRGEEPMLFIRNRERADSGVGVGDDSGEENDKLSTGVEGRLGVIGIRGDEGMGDGQSATLYIRCQLVDGIGWIDVRTWLNASTCLSSLSSTANAPSSETSAFVDCDDGPASCS